MIYAGVPWFFVLGLEDGQVAAFWLLLWLKSLETLALLRSLGFELVLALRAPILLFL